MTAPTSQPTPAPTPQPTLLAPTPAALTCQCDVLSTAQASGTGVSSWNGFIQSTTVKQPTFYSNGGLNNCSYISFDRTSSQFLSSGAMTLNILTNGGFTFVSLLRLTGAVASGEYIFYVVGASGTVRMSFVRSSTLDAFSFQIFNGSTVLVNVYPERGIVVQGEWAVYVLRYSTSTGFAQIFKNGQSVSIGGSMSKIPNQLLMTTYIGASSSAGNPVNMDLGALYMLDFALTDDQISSMTTNLTLGVPVTPPSPPVIGPTALDLPFQTCCRLDRVVQQINGSSISNWSIFIQPNPSRQPAFVNSGGYGNQAFASFARSKSQFMFAARTALNILTNGGFTLIGLLRFTGSAGFFERIFATANGPDTDVAEFFRFQTTDRLGITIFNQGSWAVSCVSDGGVIVQGEWAVMAVRYSVSTGIVEIYKNGVLVGIAGSDVPVTDKRSVNTYIGKSSYPTDALTNMDVMSLYVFDFGLRDSQLDSLTANLTQGITIDPPTSSSDGEPVIPTPRLYRSGCVLEPLAQVTSGTSVADWGGFTQPSASKRPTFYSSGGYNNQSFVAFNRSLSQSLFGGYRALNISTNGGFSAVMVLRFTGTIASSERVFGFCKVHSNYWFGDAVVVGRAGTFGQISFQMSNDLSVAVNVVSENVIVQGEWTVIAVRYSAARGLAEIFKDGIGVGVGGVQAFVTNKRLTATYLAKSADLVSSYPAPLANIDLGALYVFDFELMDAQLSSLSANLTAGIPVILPSPPTVQPFVSPLVFAACCQIYPYLLENGTVLGYDGFRQPFTGKQPTFLTSGGYMNQSFLSFDRSASQYLFGGNRVLNIGSRGGFTAVALVRFKGSSVGNSERILDFGSADSSGNIIAMGRYNAGDRFLFQAYNGGTAVVTLVSGSVIVQGEWAVYAVRYTKSSNLAEIYKNDTLLVNGTATAPLTNRYLTNTYIGRSNVGGVTMTTMDLAALYVAEFPLTDVQLSAVTTNLTAKLPVSFPGSRAGR